MDAKLILTSLLLSGVFVGGRCVRNYDEDIGHYYDEDTYIPVARRQGQDLWRPVVSKGLPYTQSDYNHSREPEGIHSGQDTQLDYDEEEDDDER